MSGFIEQLLAEAEAEAGLDKTANDANGAPETSSNQEQGGGDIMTTAQAFLQKVEQFKAALGENVAAQGQDPNAQAQAQPDPNAQAQAQAQVQDPNAQAQAQPAPGANGGVLITRPDGTQIKLASLSKLASVRGSKLFKEV